MAERSPLRLRLARGGDTADWAAEAIAVSSNCALAPNLNKLYWRFAGRRGWSCRRQYAR